MPCRVETVVCGKGRTRGPQIGLPPWPRPPLTPREACWAALVAGEREQRIQYPNSTPDAWTPFVLSAWIRNTAKLWTGEPGHAPVRWGVGEEGPRAAPHTFHRQQEKRWLGAGRPASLGTCYHRGEPRGGVNEEFWGLGCPLPDPPESDQHVGRAQDYEGEPKNLGETDLDKAGRAKREAFAETRLIRRWLSRANVVS